MTDKTTSEVLNLAADLIEERGWIDGTWPLDHSSDMPLCLEGGIMAALNMTWPEEADEEEWERTVLLPCPSFVAVRDYLGGARPYWWNDQVGRTQAEVIEVLRATAVIEAAREQQSAEVSA